MRDGEQLLGNTFNEELEKICKKLNIKYRSSHQLRFTVATMLFQVKNDYMAKEGPNESDFEDSCYLWKDEAVSVIGVVNSYKGETCTWYRLNTGEFISSEYLTTKKPTNASEVVGGNKTPQTQGTQSQTQGESPLSDMTDQEIQDALNAALSGNPSNTGSTTPDGRPKAEVHLDGSNAPDGTGAVWSN